MNLSGFDHIVLSTFNVQRALGFYQTVLGMHPREERPGKWSLHFADVKISLQDAADLPEIARQTVPGSGNFCLTTSMPIKEVIDRLSHNQVEILLGPTEKIGAIGTLLSVYFYDPDGNLVEISNRLP